MKRIASILLLATLAILTWTCKKDPEPNAETFEITDQCEVGPASVRITGTYAWPGKINSIKLQVGKRNDFSDAASYDTDLDADHFSVTVAGLDGNTEYNYRYAVDYGGRNDYLTEAKRFATSAIGLPKVMTGSVTDITASSAKARGEVTEQGASRVTERGVCWSTEHNPTISDDHNSNGDGEGSYEVVMTALAADTTYYVRAYAKNSQGTAYGDEVSFVTLDGPPTYRITVSASPSDGGTVMGGGNYADGQPCTLTATANPPYTFARWTKEGVEVSTNSTYTFTVTGPADYVAEFVGEPFVDIEIVNVTKTSISVKTKLSNFPDNTITEKGICYGQSPDLTYYSHEHIAYGGAENEFFSDITGLVSGDRYYVRSYVRSGGELSYSSVVDTLTWYPWYYVTDIPGQSRTQSFSFAIDSKAYIGTGVYQNYMYLEDMWEYDTETGTWTQKANYPEGKVRGPMAFSLNGKAYVGLGYRENGTNEGEKMDTFYEYDPVMNSWTRKHDFPGGWDGYDSRDAVALNGKGYFFTEIFPWEPGVAHNRGVNLYEYDPNGDRWTFVNALMYSGYWYCCHISAETIGSDLYVYLRNHDGNWGRDGVAFYQYNMEYNTWVEKTCSIPITYTKMESFVKDDCFYLFSGNLYGGVHNSTVYKYYPGTDSWTENEISEPKIFRYNPVCLMIGGKLYYGGGDNEGNQRSIWVYDPSFE